MQNLEELQLKEVGNLVSFQKSTRTLIKTIVNLPKLRDVFLRVSYHDFYEFFIPFLDDPNLLKKFNSFKVHEVTTIRNQERELSDIQELKKMKDLFI